MPQWVVICVKISLFKAHSVRSLNNRDSLSASMSSSPAMWVVVNQVLLFTHQSHMSYATWLQLEDFVPSIALIYVTAVELSQSILTCLLFSLLPKACKAKWIAFNSNSLMCNWLSVPDHKCWVVSPSRYAPQSFFDASVLISMTGFPFDIGSLFSIP